jgi:hypothetical protein
MVRVLEQYININPEVYPLRFFQLLQTQKERLKNQMTRDRQECLELEMNVQSMLIKVKEPPPIGKSRLICGYCHHCGHRNSKMKKCTEHAYCGIKDKNLEHFSKLNSLMVELKKKKFALLLLFIMPHPLRMK